MKSLSNCRIFNKSILTVIILAVSVSVGSAAEPMTRYCQVPPHVVQNSPPNILTIFDNSGSMMFFAYADDENFNPNRRYYGYFNPDQWYVYLNSNLFQPSGAIAGARPANSWSGNFLNWLTMRRVDVLRKIMTGGKSAGDGANTTLRGVSIDAVSRGNTRIINAAIAESHTPYPLARSFLFTVSNNANSISTFAVRNAGNGNIANNIRVEVLTPPPVEGVLQRTVGDRARVGLMFYDGPNDYDGGKLVVEVGKTDSLARTIREINNVYPQTGTPLGETLWSAVGYYAQQASAVLGNSQAGRGPRYHNADYAISANGDPMNFGAGDSPHYPSCQKNFILLLTDGEPTLDGKLPNSILTYAEGADRSNFACGITCPARNGPGYSFPVSDFNIDTAGQENLNGQTGLEDVALFMHTNDLRPDIPGFQNITLFTVFAYGEGSTLLQYAAINGGFGATRPGDRPSVTQPYNWDRNGNGVPDNYFEATDGEELEKAVQNAFLGILKRASSGTAATVMASGEGSGANLAQAMYYPSRSIGGENIAWTSEIRNLWYYVDPFFTKSSIYEETSPDSILDLANDYMIEYYHDPGTGQTRVKKYISDTQGNRGALQDDVDFEQVKTLWDAGGRLWSRNPNSRTIWTSLDGSTRTDFSTTNASVLTANMLETNVSNAIETITYVKGIDSPGLRSRTAPSGIDNAVWKLGDVINSSPQIVASTPLNKYLETYNDQTYKKFTESTLYRDRGMVFAGGNDGMLHAFRFGKLETTWIGKPASQKARLTPSGGLALGDEAWAFIPRNSLPYLKYLKDPDYCHLYFVDLAPYVFDASIAGASTDARTENSWRTVLIGGMRTGGACSSAVACTNANNCVRTPDGGSIGYSSYFALDVTDPENPAIMWEFTNPNLGFATTGPSVVRMNAVNPVSLNRDQSLNGEWYIVFGSGPTGPITSNQFLGRSNQPLRFFILDLKTGALTQTIDTGIANAFAGSILNTAADFELDYQDDVIYAGYVKKESGAGVNWNDGGVGRITTKGLSPGVSGGWEFSRVLDGIGPVTSSVARLQSKNLSTNWLFFGTGRFFFDIKAASDLMSTDDETAQRALFGVKEPCFTANNTINSSCTTTLVKGDLRNVTDAENASDDMGIKGWFIDLESNGDYTYDGSSHSYWAERVITNPVPAAYGVVYFTTFKPYSDECSIGGKSFLWAARYDSGGAPVGQKGKAMMQVSTGSVEQIDLSVAFVGAEVLHKQGRRSAAIEGIPPSAQGLALLAAPPPVKRIMHMIPK